MSEPIIHHYIPQFVLKKFYNIDKKLFYWNVKEQHIQERNPRTIYMKENLYRDEKNHPDDPTIIERKFGVLERKISDLFKNKILDKNSIKITREDNELLRKYLFLLSFRSHTRNNQYVDEKFDPHTREHLSEFLVDNDFKDLWLREIHAILDAKDLESVLQNESISTVTKMDFQLHLNSYFMTFLATRGQDILLSDTYPTSGLYQTAIPGVNFNAHFIYPLTPDLVLILNHIAFREEVYSRDASIKDVITKSFIKGDLITTPKPKYKIPGIARKDDEYTYKVNKIYEKDVISLNLLILNEVRDGFTFASKERIFNSVLNYEENDVLNKRMNYDKFLNR